MLYKTDSDTEVVRAWLTTALSGNDAKGRRAALAVHCRVSSQAVSGWLRTGRITKKNLELATAFFGHGPSFTSKAVAARTSGGEYRATAPCTPPPPPLRNFADRHDISDTDWALLQDVKDGATPAEFEAIRNRAQVVRERVAEHIAGLRGKPDDEQP